MNTILLEPTDVLFFRDGRPMGGASSGHGAAWPLPNVISHAFHAALHRAGFDGSHRHVPGRSSSPRDHSAGNREQNGRVFGSLGTAGPFPVREDAKGLTWYFPRPADVGAGAGVILFPTPKTGRHSSLPAPLCYPVCRSLPPSKDTPGAWMRRSAWDAYLGSGGVSPSSGSLGDGCDFLNDGEFADTEHHYGIGIDPETGSVADGQFYSAHYLRLRPSWRLGVFSGGWDKGLNEDLVLKLLTGEGQAIVTGGQQRVCTAKIVSADSASEPLPLPIGPRVKGCRVKWVLLSPAIWPRIAADEARGIREHSGGWLPNWVCPQSGDVLLKSGDTVRGPREPREAWRARVRKEAPISARLVAAVTGKPIPVTGYATASPHWDVNEPGGAKSTHLAVPAGSVYYFETDDEAAALRLADMLNWHGNTAGTAIRNRRSTLMGEKGFGLGVCGAWDVRD
jgi:CRISPR-associated protein Cmr3